MCPVLIPWTKISAMFVQGRERKRERRKGRREGQGRGKNACTALPPLLGLPLPLPPS
jgi:hypothetical protein